MAWPTILPARSDTADQALRRPRKRGHSIQEGARTIDLALAAYTLLGGTPFRLRVAGWVEARGVTSGANVMGFSSPRFGLTPMWPEEDPRNQAFRQAAVVAGIAARSPIHRLVLRDLQAAYRDGGVDAFVFAYRAVEGVRHTVKAGDASDAVWKEMHHRLGTSKARTQDLARVATLVRHGQASHDLVRAASKPKRRAELLEAARDVARAEIARIAKTRLPTL